MKKGASVSVPSAYLFYERKGDDAIPQFLATFGAKRHCVSPQKTQRAFRNNRASVLYLLHDPQFMEILVWLARKLYSDVWIWFWSLPLSCLLIRLLFQWITFLLYVPFMLPYFNISPFVALSLRKEYLSSMCYKSGLKIVRFSLTVVVSSWVFLFDPLSSRFHQG